MKIKKLNTKDALVNGEITELFKLAEKLNLKTLSDIDKFAKEHGNVKDQELLDVMRKEVSNLVTDSEDEDKFTKEEQEEYEIDENGYSLDSFDKYVHCQWCGGIFLEDDTVKELHLGRLCDRCADGLWAQGEKLKIVDSKIKDKDTISKSEIENKLRKIMTDYLLKQGYDKEDIDAWLVIRVNDYKDEYGSEGIMIEIANEFVSYYELPKKIKDILDAVVAPGYFEPYDAMIWQACIWHKTLKDSEQNELSLKDLIKESYEVCQGKHIDNEFPSVDDVWEDLENNYSQHKVVDELFKSGKYSLEDTIDIYRTIEGILHELKLPFFTYDKEDNLIKINDSEIKGYIVVKRDSESDETVSYGVTFKNRLNCLKEVDRLNNLNKDKTIYYACDEVPVDSDVEVTIEDSTVPTFEDNKENDFFIVACKALYDGNCFNTIDKCGLDEKRAKEIWDIAFNYLTKA